MIHTQQSTISNYEREVNRLFQTSQNASDLIEGLTAFDNNLLADRLGAVLRNYPQSTPLSAKEAEIISEAIQELSLEIN